MPYDRWGMTNAEAEELTGVGDGSGSTLTDAVLEDAEDELADEIGWTPDPAGYTLTGLYADRRALAFGKAVAWQAAHRITSPPAADDEAKVVESESVGGGDYRVDYAIPVVEGGPIANRARRLLTRHGWYARSRTGATAVRPRRGTDGGW